MNSEQSDDGTDVPSPQRHLRTKAALHSASWKAYVPLEESGLWALNGPPLAPSTSSGRRVSSPTDLSLLLWHCQRGKAHQATLHIQPRSRKKQQGAGFSEGWGSHITTHLSTSFSNRSSALLATKGSGWRWLAWWGSSRCCPTTNAPVSHSSLSSAFWSFCKQWSDTSWEHNHMRLPRVCLWEMPLKGTTHLKI